MEAIDYNRIIFGVADEIERRKDNETMLTFSEVGIMLGGEGKPISRGTLHRWYKDGKIPKPVNGRFKKSGILDYLNNSKT